MFYAVNRNSCSCKPQKSSIPISVPKKFMWAISAATNSNSGPWTTLAQAVLIQSNTALLHCKVRDNIYFLARKLVIFFKFVFFASVAYNIRSA